MTTDDKKFIESLQSGDADAFEILVKKYETKIYNLALRMTGNPDDAMDIAQETFLRVYRSIGEFGAKSSLGTWIFRIASNVALDFLRKRKRRNEVSTTTENEDGEEVELEFPDERNMPENVSEAKELREAIDEGIAQLTPEYRQIFVMRDILGMSYTDIANTLYIAEGTVKSRIARARGKIASFLIKNGNFSPAVKSNGWKGGRVE